jgi:hypothetical protein
VKAGEKLSTPTYHNWFDLLLSQGLMKKMLVRICLDREPFFCSIWKKKQFYLSEKKGGKQL